MTRLAANLSMLYASEPVSARAAHALADGYTSVESWWPWAELEVSEAQRDAFVASLAGVHLRLLNVWEGPAAYGARGLAAIESAGGLFRRSSELALDLAQRSHADAIHVLCGVASGAGAHRTLIDRLSWFAEQAGEVGIVLEYLNPIDHPGYVLDSLDTVVAVIDAVRRRVPAASIGLLADTYHLGMAAISVSAVLPLVSSHLAYVQVADSIRSIPGAGSFDVVRFVAAVLDAGYHGTIGAEFRAGTAVPTHDELQRILLQF